MPHRRAFLTATLPALIPGAALAQESRQRRIRTDDGGAFMGGGVVLPSAPAPASGAMRADIAPMPNSNWEAPQPLSGDPNAPRLAPGVISPTMPGRGMAQGNSQASINDRLFRPAPSAHLHIPMNW